MKYGRNKKDRGRDDDVMMETGMMVMMGCTTEGEVAGGEVSTEGLRWGGVVWAYGIGGS